MSIFCLHAISTLDFLTLRPFLNENFYLLFNNTTKQHKNNQFLVTDIVLAFAYLYSQQCCGQTSFLHESHCLQEFFLHTVHLFGRFGFKECCSPLVTAGVEMPI